jgi:2-methylcitrate dehydratase PrpD
MTTTTCTPRDLAAAREITTELAEYATRSRFSELPQRVQNEAARAFLNWMGCALGGSRDPAVAIAIQAVAETGGASQASVIGHELRTDVGSAAFVNCMSSSALAFDDTHLATVTHPTGPVAAALFALCEKEPTTGEEFLNALALGIEIECRMSNVLLLPPSKSNLGFFVTGLTGPIGTAAAVGRLLRLDERGMRSAIGLGAAQAAGFRSTHGSMAAAFVPAHAARTGYSAALLASKGFTCSDAALEAPKGFIDVFANAADPRHAVEGLGQRFELLSNAYKPYPCGIVIHPALDACLEIAASLEPGIEPVHIKLRVHPLALSLTDRPSPKDPLEAQISLQHWAAVSFVHREAGLAQLQQDSIDSPSVSALRKRVSAIADGVLQRDEAVAEVTLPGGQVLRAHIAHARGSVDRPMPDDELDAKFESQAAYVLTEDAATRLRHLCRNASSLGDIGSAIASVWAYDSRMGDASTFETVDLPMLRPRTFGTS